MKKVLLIITLIITSFSVSAQFHKAKLLDEHKGLIGSDIKLGMEMKNIPDLEFSKKSYDEDWYRRKNENLNLLGIKLKEILYRFEEGKVVEILIDYEEKDKETIFSNLSGFYGQYTTIPVYPNGETNIIGWRGKKVLFYNSYTKDFIIKEDDIKAKKNILKYILESDEYFIRQRIYENISDEKERKHRAKEAIKSSRKGILNRFEEELEQYKKKLKEYKKSKYVTITPAT